MVSQTLDITGVVCPFCVIRVKQAMDALQSGDELLVISDHPPAAKDSIPAFAGMNGWQFSVRSNAPGLWEITLKKEDQ